MFICQVVGKVTEPGEKINKIVVATRDRIYKEKVFNEELRKYEEVVVGHGTEIVREISASDEGLQVWNEMSEADRAKYLASF